jgi:hypothetical protein
MTAQRMTYHSIATVVSLGISHTGFDKESWVLYFPAGFLTFAGITGICLGFLFWKKCRLK